MKRLCFGTLMSILYQARNQKVTNNLLCDAIFSSYAQSIELRDGSLPGHLKSGRDNVPPDVIDAARNTSFEDAEKVFQTKVISLIKDSKRESVVRAIKDVLREDTNIQDQTVIGYIEGYEKNNILINSTFSLSALLASVFYFAIIEVKNQECKEAIKEIDKNYVESFESSSESVFFERAKADVYLPLQKTLHDPVFGRVFNQVSSLTISGLANPSNVKIYGVDVNNCKFKFKSLKEYLIDNIRSYVFSRAKANRYTSSGKSASIGAQALIRFMQAYGTCAETILGEMLLYVFMEQELNAPKIMSKIEIDDLGGMSCSKSDGVHLLAVENNGQLFHQLVFGASDIYGDLTASIDRAFDKIIDIENNSDIELKMVENTTHNNIYDPDTTNYMIDLLLHNGTMSPYQIAKKVDISRSSIYNALEHMVEVIPEVEVYSHERERRPENTDSRIMIVADENIVMIADSDNARGNWSGTVSNNKLMKDVVREHIHNDIYMLKLRNIYGREIYDKIQQNTNQETKDCQEIKK